MFFYFGKRGITLNINCELLELIVKKYICEHIYILLLAVKHTQVCIYEHIHSHSRIFIAISIAFVSISPVSQQFLFSLVSNIESKYVQNISVSIKYTLVCRPEFIVLQAFIMCSTR